MSEILNKLRAAFVELVDEHDLRSEAVEITASPLSPEEAIGRTGRKDFPLVSGRERLVQARFRAARGVAFTDMPADYSATLGEVLALDLDDNGKRAFFVASLNAVCRHLFDDLKTAHCKDDAPVRCGRDMAADLLERFGRVRVGVVGLNPAIVEGLAAAFGPENVFVADMDLAKVGTTVAGVRIHNGRSQTGALFEFAEVVLATGTTLANATADGIVARAERRGVPLLFYGVTCAAAAQLLGFERMCPYAA